MWTPCWRCAPRRATSPDAQGADAAHRGERHVSPDRRGAVHHPGVAHLSAIRFVLEIGQYPVVFPTTIIGHYYEGLTRASTAPESCSAGGHPQVSAGRLARGAAAMRLGQCAPGGDARSKRCSNGWCRAWERNAPSGGSTPPGGATACALAGDSGGRSRGGVSRARPACGTTADHVPHSECLRPPAWSPPCGGTLTSLAALAAPLGPGALPRATENNLVTVLSENTHDDRTHDDPSQRRFAAYTSRASTAAGRAGHRRGATRSGQLPNAHRLGPATGMQGRQASTGIRLRQHGFQPT